MKTFIYKCLICVFGFASIWLLCGIADPNCSAPWWVWPIASFVSAVIAICLIGVLSDIEKKEQKEFQRKVNKHIGPGCHYDEN